MKKRMAPLSAFLIAAVLGTGVAVPYNVLNTKAAIAQAATIEQAQVTQMKGLNPITMEITFSQPLPQEEIALDQAQKNFVFDHGLTIRNIPQLKTGTTSTYIVPTTPQQAGITYTLTYKGEENGIVSANTEKIALRSAQQVAMDTIEVESRLQDQVTDYENVIAAQVGKRNGLDFVLDQNNQYKGKTYQIVPSLRAAQVTITPENGTPIIATYVPWTQATDGRQAPKFRLQAGESLKPGVQYTVTSEWATFRDAKFTAKQVAPLTIRSVKDTSPTTVEVTLAKDPKDELFASRRVELTAADGTKLTAQYKVTTRKGAVGVFEIVDGGKLASGTPYTVTPVGNWATARNVSFVSSVQADAAVEVTSLRALNPITLEVTFSAPLSKEEIALDQALKNVTFDNGLAIRNIPQLKTGTTATYYVPTTSQAAGKTYTLFYKGEKAGTFAANTQKIIMQAARQVSYDTLEVESSLADGVTDYENVIAAQAGKRNGLDFTLDASNRYKGKTYQIVPSMRAAQVKVTPAGGETMIATYVPWTQATDGRQAPKFRLPNGETFQPGVTYTVEADWAVIKKPSFAATQIASLTIRLVKELTPSTLEVTLSKDPKDEVFASRQIVLTDAEGKQMMAQYKVTTRKGATGIFELLDGAQLSPKTTYSVTAVGQWAGVTFTAK
ncbi:MAG: hypothetical protein ACM32O_19100 [Clostridia bacterium]